MSDEGPPMIETITGKDPAFSVIFSILMPRPAFEAVEASLYRLLHTGASDEHVDVWSGKGGRVVFAHAPVVATSASSAMAEGRRLADKAILLCPGGSALREVQVHDWNDETSEATTFWTPERPRSPGFAGSAISRWLSRRKRAPHPDRPNHRDATEDVFPTLPAVEFEGIASGEAGLAVFPYEFLTDTGVMVRLHDMRFLGADYRADSAQLTLRFLYVDYEYTPAEAREAPMAVFRFEDVQVQRWEDLDDPGPDPNRIVAMLYVERHRFMQLATGRTNLKFTIRRMSVSMEPSR